MIDIMKCEKIVREGLGSNAKLFLETQCDGNLCLGLRTKITVADRHMSFHVSGEEMDKAKFPNFYEEKLKMAVIQFQEQRRLAS
jgi:hypothetical protein